MGKVIILKFDGDLEQTGFRVNSTVQEEVNLGENYGFRTLTEVNGGLSANAELALLIQEHWQQKYRHVGTPAVRKLESKKIIVRGNLYQRKQECRESAKRLCKTLTHWLESPEFRTIDQQLREAIVPDESIRFLIRTEDPQLYKLPWEEWDLIKRHSQTEVVFGSRKRQTHLKPPHSILKPKVKILAILGHSEGIDIEKDKQQLENLKSVANVVFLVEPKRKDISDKLWEQPWDIIFFAGHSETHEDTGRIYLNSQGEYLELQDLWYGLRQAVENGLKVAIFNSCDGLGLAQSLDDLQIPLMIVMREIVPDKVAQQFFMNFIEAFRQGKPFHLAEREAREKLQELEDEYPCATWLPIIYQNLETPPLQWVKSTDLPSKYHPVAAVLTSFLTMLLVILIRQLGLLQGLELKAYDHLIRMRPNEGLDPRILVVEASEADINKHGFPIPDEIIAKAINKLETHQPRIIALDIFRDRLESEESASLATILQENNRIIAVCSVREIDNPNKPGISPPPRVPGSRLGYTDVIVDADGILRRHLMFMTPHHSDPCTTNHSLSSRAALRYLAIEGIQAEKLSKDLVQIGDAIFTDLEANTGAYHQLDERGFQVMLNYRSSQPVAQTVQLQEVLEGQIQPDWVEDQLVLMGITAPSTVRDFFTPYSRVWGQYKRMPGVQLKAQMTSQMLSAVLDGRSLIWTWSALGDGVWIGIWSVIGVTIIWQTSKIKYSVVVLVLITGTMVIILWGICYGIFLRGGWIPFVPALLVLVASEVALLSYPALWKTLTENNFIRRSP